MKANLILFVATMGSLILGTLALSYRMRLKKACLMLREMAYRFSSSEKNYAAIGQRYRSLEEEQRNTLENFNALMKKNNELSEKYQSMRDDVRGSRKSFEGEFIAKDGIITDQKKRIDELTKMLFEKGAASRESTGSRTPEQKAGAIISDHFEAKLKRIENNLSLRKQKLSNTAERGHSYSNDLPPVLLDPIEAALEKMDLHKR